MSQYKVKLDDYLSADFKPELVANKLIRETTLAQETSVDVNPALKRLKYDRQEIEASTKQLCESNTDALIEYAQVTETLAEKIKPLAPSLENMTGSYEKLERDFLKPYHRALNLHNAAEKLSYTTNLCRNLSWYLQLALQAQSQEFKREGKTGNGGVGTAMLRTAQALQTLDEILDFCPDLLKINAVKHFQDRAPSLRSDLSESATAFLKESGRKNPAQAKLAASALIALDANIVEIINVHIRALIGTTVLQLSRNSGNAIDHERVFAEAQQRERDVQILVTIGNDLTSASNLKNDFWDRVAVQLDQKLKTMSVANPTAMKNMTAIRSSILACTQVVTSVHSVFEKYLTKQ